VSNADTELLLQPVMELSRRIAAKKLSPVELAEATLRQVKRLQPVLNAYAEPFDEFLASAKAAEKDISAGRSKGPLHGIPVGLKDLVHVAGKRTKGGSVVLDGPPAKRDATITTKLKAAGALITGKLNMVEFAFGFAGVNPHTGDVKNPWNTERITAGSSSGSGAAVATGMAAMAIGSDTGGSIRMPAAACGITGHKPTYGLVSRHGVLDLCWSQDTVGPMCRTAADCALMMNALAGHDRLDPASARRQLPDFTSRFDSGLKGLRIGVPKGFFFDDIDSQIEAAVREAVSLMGRNEAKVREVSMPWVRDGRAVNVGVLLPEAATVHREVMEKRAKEISPAVRVRLEAGLKVSAVDYIHAQRARAKFSHQMAEAMRDVDLVVTPSVPIATPTRAECTPAPGESTAPGGGRFPTFTGVFNATGQPSLSVNCGFTKDGLPIGLMISGRPFEDAVVLGAGHAYQQLTDWHGRTPKVLG
jgi:aspartyl-tRNA(Asn)/glutamyl-tRNA(Gln) amidotransferase subunit A